MLSRRDFVVNGSVLVAGLTFSRKTLSQELLRSSSSAQDFLPDPPDRSFLREIATRAVDTARSSGAAYADIRVGHTQDLSIRVTGTAFSPGVQIGSSLSYGVRVMVDGAWVFVHGNTTNQTMVEAVRAAVSRARAYSKISVHNERELTSLASSDQVIAEWLSPVKVEPLTIPVFDQADRLGALNAAFRRVAGIRSDVSYSSADWSIDTRVFASTEGTMTTQVLTRSRPQTYIVTVGGLVRTFPGLTPSLGGFETLLNESLEDRIKGFAEESVELGNFPYRSINVGRYPLLLDGASMGKLTGETLLPALDLGRVLGYEADAVGTSYLSHYGELLGTPIVSSPITLITDRSAPSIGSIKWDDDGVELRDTTLIDKGRLNDYLTTRITAPVLSAWYTKLGKPIRSNGSSVVRDPSHPPTTAALGARIAAGEYNGGTASLIKDMKRGIYIMEASVFPDQSLGSVLLTSWRGLMFGIENGKITHRLRAGACQARTSNLWKSIEALGDQTTVASAVVNRYVGQPTRDEIETVVSAPACRASSIDLIDLRR